MTIPSWPSGLPQSLLLGDFKETQPDLVIRTEMDAGPHKVRRRFTAGVTKISGSQRLTKSQVSTFETFYNTTLLGGSLRFTWKDPLGGTSAEIRFVSTPVISAHGIDDFAIEMELEILP